MPQLSRALASEPLLAAHLLGPLCAVISGHRSTRLHQEIPALRKPSSSSSRKSPLTPRYQPLVYSRIVGKPYLGIISGLLVTRQQSAVVGSPSYGTVIPHEIRPGTSILTLRLVARDLLQFRDTVVVAQSSY